MQCSRIILVIGGGIAAYKSLTLIRDLRREGYRVVPVLTRAAEEFVTPRSVAALAAEEVHRDLFDLTRENVMRQAANYQKYKLPLLLPGITINTSPTDYYPIQSVQLARFKGETWDLFGDVMSAEGS